ncbi:MAG TPA: hypothetical protein VFF52_20815 [Isosphaeraceae bacterium]|nr:hypothetical protein [Isosphaeraceae bacterium]
MVKALSLLSLIRGLSLLSLVRGLSLTGSRRLELGDLVIPLMMAVMEEREEDATLQVLDQALEPGPTTRPSLREPTGDILP